MTLSVAFLTNPRVPSEKTRKAVLDTFADALEVYENAFGPYPLDTLAVAVWPASRSQGALGFITIDRDLVTDYELDRVSAENADTLAHELAHQWWGNMVPWASYRDQWLSEAIATYAAALYDRRSIDESPQKRAAAAMMAIDAKSRTLDFASLVDRPDETLGPVSIGARLDSSLSDTAYQAVVYDKGAMVFSALGDKLRPDALIAMLREIAQRAREHPIDADTFFGALEKMSGKDLASFRRQFVDGVGYPEVQLRYAIEQRPDGTSSVKGAVLQVPRGFRRDALVREGEAGWKLAPTFEAYQPVDDASIQVHVLAAIDDPGAESATAPKGDEPRSLKGYGFMVTAVGESTDFETSFPTKITRIVADPWRSAPTKVVDLVLEPKSGLMERAEAAARIGRFDEADAAYREALSVPLGQDERAWLSRSAAERKWADRLANGRIGLSLAGLDADRGDLDRAASDLARDDVSALVHDVLDAELEKKALLGRLALQRGDSRGAYDLLSKSIRLDFVQKESDTPADALRHRAFEAGKQGTPGELLLLAMAARIVGQNDVYEQALEEASRAGADVSSLRRP